MASEQAGFSVTQIGAGPGLKQRETSLKYTERHLTLALMWRVRWQGDPGWWTGVKVEKQKIGLLDGKKADFWVWS